MIRPVMLFACLISSSLGSNYAAAFSPGPAALLQAEIPCSSTIEPCVRTGDTHRLAPILASSKKSTTTPKCFSFNEATQIFKSASWCVSSFLRSQGKNTYGPRNLTRKGAWCEGVKGYGIGEAVMLTFQGYPNDARPPSYDRLVISNGYDKTSKTFLENSRVKQIEIRTDSGKFWIRTLKDETGPQEISLGGEIAPLSVTITILDVYPGNKYDDTCISGLYADFGM